MRLECSEDVGLGHSLKLLKQLHVVVLGDTLEALVREGHDRGATRRRDATRDAEHDAALSSVKNGIFKRDLLGGPVSRLIAS